MKIKFYHFIILAAIVLTSIAAYFSIFGISNLFTNIKYQIIFLMINLEISKIFISIILYRWRKKLPVILKTFFSVVLFILMFITSTGVYSYLNNSYQKISNDLNIIQFESKFINDKDNLLNIELNNLKKEYEGYNKNIDNYYSIKNLQENRLNEAFVKEYNNRMIENLRKDIDNTTKLIDKLNNEKNKLNDKILNKNSEILNLKKDNYKIKEKEIKKGEVSSLIYISKILNISLDKIASFFIILIVMILDPLAITLILASNIVKDRKDKYDIIKDENKEFVL